MIAAPFAASDPRGSSRSSVSSDTAGRLSSSDRRSGAPNPVPAKTEAATLPCQLSLSTSTTTFGRVVSLVAGQTAPATPATSAIASPPPTRVVFLVAVNGKPRSLAASWSFAFTPIWGGVLPSSSPSEHPAKSAQPARRSVGRRATWVTLPGRFEVGRGTIDWSVNEGIAVDFRLTDEQIEFQQHCRKFSAEVIRPVAAKYDREQSVPWPVIKEARKWNLHGLEYIQKVASDPDGLFGVIYAGELHWGCAASALAISASSLAAAGIASSGTPEQIAQWVPECYGTGDEIKMGAYAVTEAGAGSDVKSLRTTARRDGDEWVLNGTKVFISNGGIADVTVVVATVDPELGHRGQASFVVPKDTPGLSMGKKESKLGIRASQTSEVILEDCRVPMDYLLGGQEKLEKKLARARSGESTGRSSNALATFELTRPLVGASALGIAQAAYEWTLEYLEDKVEDGTPLLEQQRVQQVLAEVATEIEAARMLVWRAAWMGRNGIPLMGGQGSMSKLKAGDVAMWATTTLMDLVGPYAQTTDCPLEKFFRDAKIYQLFEGTAQVQRLVIARMQRTEYQQRLHPAEPVAEENGRKIGDVVREAAATLPSG